MSRDDSTTVTAWLDDATSGQASPDFDVDTVVSHTLALVSDADHVSITIKARRGDYRTLASTSPTSERADRLQYEIGEGPCVDALSENDWYRTGDVAGDRRWPRWGPKAAALGVGSLLSVRLLADGGQPFGALNMYADQTGHFSDRDEVDLALVWATHAAFAISAARTVSDLETALSSRHLIGVAQGMLMERYGLDEHSSFTLLRRLSSHRNIKVRDLAAEFIASGRLPD